jgi:hypothetical protein
MKKTFVIQRISVWLGFVVTLGVTAGCTEKSQPQPPNLDKSVLESLAPRTVDVAEKDKDFISRVTAGHSNKIGCVSEPFGFEPTAAKTMDEVQKAYVTLSCSAVAKDPALGSSLVTPAAVTIQPTPKVEAAPEGGDYTGAVKKLIPERWWTQAFNGFTDHSKFKTELNERIALLSKNGSSPS